MESDSTDRIAVIIADEAWLRCVPDIRKVCHDAVLAALAHAGGGFLAVAPGDPDPFEIAVRLTDDDEVAALNRTWRGKEGPTNVLSFEGDDPAEAAARGTPCHLGDIVLAQGTVAGEAMAANRSVSAHLSHLVVHGTLHLLGHDHADDDEAVIMETAEIAILARLGIANPYDDDALPCGHDASPAGPDDATDRNAA